MLTIWYKYDCELETMIVVYYYRKQPLLHIIRVPSPRTPSDMIVVRYRPLRVLSDTCIWFSDIYSHGREKARGARIRAAHTCEIVIYYAYRYASYRYTLQEESIPKQKNRYDILFVILYILLSTPSNVAIYIGTILTFRRRARSSSIHRVFHIIYITHYIPIKRIHT